MSTYWYYIIQAKEYDLSNIMLTKKSKRFTSFQSCFKECIADTANKYWTDPKEIMLYYSRAFIVYVNSNGSISSNNNLSDRQYETYTLVRNGQLINRGDNLKLTLGITDTEYQECLIPDKEKEHRPNMNVNGRHHCVGKRCHRFDPLGTLQTLHTVHKI